MLLLGPLQREEQLCQWDWVKPVRLVVINTVFMVRALDTWAYIIIHIAKYLKRNFLVSACVINYLISYNVPTFNSCTILWVSQLLCLKKRRLVWYLLLGESLILFLQSDWFPFLSMDLQHIQFNTLLVLVHLITGLLGA